MPPFLWSLSSMRRKVGLPHVAQRSFQLFTDWGRSILWLQLVSKEKLLIPILWKSHPGTLFSCNSSWLILGAMGSGCCILRIILSFKMSGRGERPPGSAFSGPASWARDTRRLLTVGQSPVYWLLCCLKKFTAPSGKGTAVWCLLKSTSGSNLSNSNQHFPTPLCFSQIIHRGP